MTQTIQNRLKELSAEKEAIIVKEREYRKMLSTRRASILKKMPQEKEIMEQICKDNGILLEEVLSGIRIKEVMQVKKIIARTFRDKGYTLERIAFLLWMKNHASVHYLLKFTDEKNW